MTSDNGYHQWNETKDDVHETDSVYYSFVSFLVILSIVGTIGNGVVLWVFWSRRGRVVATLFIVVLAAVDFSTCAVVIPFTVYMELAENKAPDSVCKLYWFLTTFNIPFSAFIMVAIAVDRYLCICRPFSRILSIQRAKVVIIVLGLCACVFGVCVALMWGTSLRFESPYRQLSNQTIDVNDTATAAAWTSSISPDIFQSSSVQEVTSALWSTNSNRRPEQQPTSDSFRQSQTAIVDDVYVTTETGFCVLNDILVSHNFQWYYKKFYHGLFLVCFVCILVLYALIFRSVLALRDRRRRQRANGGCARYVHNNRPRSPDVILAAAAAAAANVGTTATRTTAIALKIPPPEQHADKNAPEIDRMLTVNATAVAVQEVLTTLPNRSESAFVTAHCLQPPPALMKASSAANLSISKHLSVLPEASVTLPAASAIEMDVYVQPRRQWRCRSRVKASTATSMALNGDEALDSTVFGGGGRVTVTGSGNELTLRDRYRLANLKTAVMLFVVTVVFIVTFLPAILITEGLVPYYKFVFYMYFANNVANPFIYSFMNRNFRDEMCPRFCSQYWPSIPGRDCTSSAAAGGRRMSRHRPPPSVVKRSPATRPGAAAAAAAAVSQAATRSRDVVINR